MMPRLNLRKTLAWLLKSAALLATWGFIFFTLAMFTEFIMAPWDTAIVQPEIGTWQRTLNDFFSVGPGERLVAGTVVLGNVYVAIRLWLKRNRLPWRFIIHNALFVWLFFPLMMLAFRLNSVIFPYPDVLYDPNYRGYHLSIVPGVVALAVIAIWFMVQNRLHDKRKRKRQAADTLVDVAPATTGRLALEEGSTIDHSDGIPKLHTQQGYTHDKSS